MGKEGGISFWAKSPQFILGVYRQLVACPLRVLPQLFHGECDTCSEVRHDKRNLLTCSEIAKETGYDKETVRRWCREGILPAFKLGQEWLVREDDMPPAKPAQLVGAK